MTSMMATINDKHVDEATNNNKQYVDSHDGKDKRQTCIRGNKQ
jgi:hypothetical protein